MRGRALEGAGSAALPARPAPAPAGEASVARPAGKMVGFRKERVTRCGEAGGGEGNDQTRRGPGGRRDPRPAYVGVPGPRLGKRQVLEPMGGVLVQTASILTRLCLSCLL